MSKETLDSLDQVYLAYERAKKRSSVRDLEQVARDAKRLASIDGENKRVILDFVGAVETLIDGLTHNNPSIIAAGKIDAVSNYKRARNTIQDRDRAGKSIKAGKYNPYIQSRDEVRKMVQNAHPPQGFKGIDSIHINSQYVYVELEFYGGLPGDEQFAKPFIEKFKRVNGLVKLDSKTGFTNLPADERTMVFIQWPQPPSAQRSTRRVKALYHARKGRRMLVSNPRRAGKATDEQRVAEIIGEISRLRGPATGRHWARQHLSLRQAEQVLKKTQDAIAQEQQRLAEFRQNRLGQPSWGPHGQSGSLVSRRRELLNSRGKKYSSSKGRRMLVSNPRRAGKATALKINLMDARRRADAIQELSRLSGALYDELKHAKQAISAGAPDATLDEDVMIAIRRAAQTFGDVKTQAHVQAIVDELRRMDRGVIHGMIHIQAPASYLQNVMNSILRLERDLGAMLNTGKAAKAPITTANVTAKRDLIALLRKMNQERRRRLTNPEGLWSNKKLAEFAQEYAAINLSVQQALYSMNPSAHRAMWGGYYTTGMNGKQALATLEKQIEALKTIIGQGDAVGILV